MAGETYGEIITHFPTIAKLINLDYINDLMPKPELELVMGHIGSNPELAARFFGCPKRREIEQVIREIQKLDPRVKGLSEPNLEAIIKCATTEGVNSIDQLAGCLREYIEKTYPDVDQ